MPCVVYVLRSESSGRLYIGHTADLGRRLAEHAAGQTAATRGRGPWTLIARRAHPSRAEAMAEERSLKALKSPNRVLERVARW